MNHKARKTRSFRWWSWLTKRRPKQHKIRCRKSRLWNRYSPGVYVCEFWIHQKSNPSFVAHCFSSFSLLQLVICWRIPTIWEILRIFLFCSSKSRLDSVFSFRERSSDDFSLLENERTNRVRVFDTSEFGISKGILFLKRGSCCRYATTHFFSSCWSFLF